jgi:serine/threonine protein kinase
VLRSRLAPEAGKETIAEAARAAFAALASVHEAADLDGPLAVVHADLSVDNVAVAEDASGAMMLDFGLACWRGSAARDGSFRGTLTYAAPEIARGEAPTTRSDLFSLAAALLHVATGTPPRSETGGPALLTVAATEPLPYEGAPSIRGLVALLGCVEVAPGKRPGSAREVLEALSLEATRARPRA